MQQSDINRAVARATNESIATIRRYGFSIEDHFTEFTPFDNEDDLEPNNAAEGVTSELALC